MNANALDGVGNQNRAFLVVIAVALAYLVVGAVSFVVAAYSVAVKVAYWDNYLNRNYNDKQLSREMVISNIDQFFQNKGYNEITN